MRSDLSEARSVMVEEASERSRKRESEGERERVGEEVPGFAGSGGMGPTPAVARCGERKRLVNPQLAKSDIDGGTESGAAMDDNRGGAGDEAASQCCSELLGQQGAFSPTTHRN